MSLVLISSKLHRKHHLTTELLILYMLFNLNLSFNFNFLHSISIFFFLYRLGLVDLLSANQQFEILACILLQAKKIQNCLKLSRIRAALDIVTQTIKR